VSNKSLTKTSFLISSDVVSLLTVSTGDTVDILLPSVCIKEEFL
jgi:hypothetical protein